MSQVAPVAPASSSPQANNNTAATTAAPGGGGAGSGSISTTISSLQDLQNKSPQVYNAMMQGISMNICNDMKKRNDELIALEKEEYPDA
jgi:hypothetical protein